MAKYLFNQTSQPSQVPIQSNEVGAFFSKLFEIRDVAHQLHLKQPDGTLATHLALGELYEEIEDMYDAVIESYQGIYGPVTFTISNPTVSNVLGYVQESYEFIGEKRSIFTESWIQNQIDNIQQLLAKTMFKLKYVK